MLARTANRWGEFMFYEDGALNLGYDKTQTPTPISDWADLKYCDLDSGMNSDKAEDSFDAEAAYSSNIMDSPLPKSPDVIKNLAGCSPANGLDVWIMKKVASFLGNTGNIPKWIGNQLFDDLYNRALAERNSKTVNDDNDSKYFEEQTEPEKYGMHEFKDLGKNLAFNPFTELHSPYDKNYIVSFLKASWPPPMKLFILNLIPLTPILNSVRLSRSMATSLLSTRLKVRLKRFLITRLRNHKW